jgi:hypothetical protein
MLGFTYKSLVGFHVEPLMFYLYRQRIKNEWDKDAPLHQSDVGGFIFGKKAFQQMADFQYSVSFEENTQNCELQLKRHFTRFFSPVFFYQASYHSLVGHA